MNLADPSWFDAWCGRLGAALDPRVAEVLADHLAAGRSRRQAIAALSSASLVVVQPLFDELVHHPEIDDATLRGVLRALVGFGSRIRPPTLLWTMPGGLSREGELTSRVHRYVEHATHHVTCSTFNFQPSSSMLLALVRAHSRGVGIDLYLDGGVEGTGVGLSTLLDRLPRAAIYTNKNPCGTSVHHAKFYAIDHRMLIVTSANFSRNAEQRNIELGVVLRDSGLAAQVEHQMREVRDRLYERRG